jgi:hypothetical protein
MKYGQMEKMMRDIKTIDKRLVTGIFVLGVLGYFDSDEVARDSSLQYIAKQLRRKHFELKNGNPKDRLFKNPEYAKKYVMRSRKRLKAMKTVEEALTRCDSNALNWLVHSEIADLSWRGATAQFTAKNEISTTDLILALFRKSPETQKFYGISDKHLEKYDKGRTEKRIFASSRVASKLLEELDIQTSYYYNGMKEKIYEKVGAPNDRIRAGT